MRVRKNDVFFDPASTIDPNGRVFHWNGGIYRGITPQAVDLYKTLIKKPGFSRLVEFGLIETDIAPLELEEYPLVLKHRKLSFVSYGFEWCGAMYKDAALLLLNLSIELAKMGLELQDGHPSNILYDGCKPVFVDFGSIVPIGEAKHWRPVKEFIIKFLNPLYLMSKGYASYPRTLRFDATGRYKILNVTKQDLVSVLSWQHKLEWLLHPTAHRTNTWRDYTRMEALHRLKEIVSGMDFELQGKTEDDDADIDSLGMKIAPDLKGLVTIIESYNPKTLLDAGGSIESLSKINSENGRMTLSLNANEYANQRLYRRLKRYGHNTLPLLIDIKNPAPAFGMYNGQMQYAAAAKRLKCEMVIALNLVHRLFFEEGMSFQEIIQMLVVFTNKQLLIDSVIPDHIAEYESNCHPQANYNRDEFIDTLNRYFKAVDIIHSGTSSGSLFLCDTPVC